MSNKRTTKIKEKFWAGNQLVYFIFELNPPKSDAKCIKFKWNHFSSFKKVVCMLRYGNLKNKLAIDFDFDPSSVVAILI